MKYASAGSTRSIVYLSVLILLKLGFQIAIYSRGFISVSADEFSRGLRAAEWTIEPHFNMLADVKETWLPFEKYLNGLFLLLWPDVIWAPRVTVFIASCLVLIALFMLVFYLFDNFLVAALTCAFVVVQPWYVWLSGTPMLEMYYLACFLGGLVFLAIWLGEERRGYWFWAGCCFMLASGFHVQSWIFINVVNLIMIVYLYRYVSHKQLGRLLRLVGFCILGNSLIIVFTIVEFLNTGHMFSFLNSHTSYSKWFYDGYNIAVLEKLLYYPRLIIHNSSGVVWILLLVALVFLLRDRACKRNLLPLAILGLALIINSAMNVFSVPATAAPARYSLFYVLMISPYLAYGTYRLFTLEGQRSSRIMAHMPVVLSAGLFLYGIWWGIVRIPDFPLGMSTDAIETGYYLDKMLSQNESDNLARYMVELRYWDFLAVELTARHYDAVAYDREKDLFNRNTPSIFTGGRSDVCAGLTSQNIRYVALRESTLKANALSTGCLRANREIGRWTVYAVYANAGS